MKLEVYGNAIVGFSGHGESDTETLDPCPFFGSQDVIVENTHTPSYHAECQFCGAEGPSGNAGKGDRIWAKNVATRLHRKAFAEAVRLWNSRV